MEVIKHNSGQGGVHYKLNGDKEVCESMEDEIISVFKKSFFQNFFRINIIANVRISLKKALWSSCAVKHELRAGTKRGNSVAMETEKAENYRNRAKFGKWIK